MTTSHLSGAAYLGPDNRAWSGLCALTSGSNVATLSYPNSRLVPGMLFSIGNTAGLPYNTTVLTYDGNVTVTLSNKATASLAAAGYNVMARCFSHVLPAITAAVDFVMAMQFRFDFARSPWGNVGTFSEALWQLLTAFTPGAVGGNSHGCTLNSADISTSVNQGRLQMTMSASGQNLMPSAINFIGTTRLLAGTTYWAFFQRKIATTGVAATTNGTTTVTAGAPNATIAVGQGVSGANIPNNAYVVSVDTPGAVVNFVISAAASGSGATTLAFATAELWVVAANTSASTPEFTQPARPDFTADYSGSGGSQFGLQSRATLGEFFMAVGTGCALTPANMTDIAAGTDPDTIVSSGNRKDFISFATPTTFTQSCTTTNASVTVACASNANIWPGQSISGTNIPAGAVVATVNSPRAVTSFTISIAATGSATNTLTFGSVLLNAWGGNSATVVGNWASQITPVGPLQTKNDGTLQFFLTDPKPWSVAPRPAAGGNSTYAISGTYAGTAYTPTAAQFQLLNANFSVAVAWTSIGSFSAAAGAWTGTMSVPEGGPYYIQVRDTNNPSLTYESTCVIVCAAVMLTSGQSPIVVGMESYTGLGAALANPLYEFWATNAAPGQVRLTEPASRIAQETGAGQIAFANQYWADSSNAPLASFPSATSGSSIKDWAGVAQPTMSAPTAYTPGEIVEVRLVSGGPVCGHGVFVSQAGAVCTFKYLDIYLDLASTDSCYVTSGSNIIYFTNNDPIWIGLQVGMQVSGTGIPGGTTITALTSGPNRSATLSANATVTTTPATITFKTSGGGAMPYAVKGVSSGTETTVTVPDVHTDPGLPQLCHPRMLDLIDQARIKNCDVVIYWLQGAGDTGTSTTWGQWADVYMARLYQDLTTARGINWKFVCIPHNREVGGSGELIRDAQYMWALAPGAYGSQIFVGPPIQDWPMVAESVGQVPGGPPNVAHDTTHITLPMSNDGTNSSDFPVRFIFHGGANDGLTAIAADATSASIVSTQSQTSCVITAGSNTVTCPANAYIAVGQTITGSNINLGTTVLSVNTPGAVTSFTMSQGGAQTQTITLTFGVAVVALHSSTPLLSTNLTGTTMDCTEMSSPHPSHIGAYRLGSRIGRDLAARSGKTAAQYYGGQVARVVIAPNASGVFDGSVFDVYLTQPIQTLGLRTPNGGPVFGFAVSIAAFYSNSISGISTTKGSAAITFTGVTGLKVGMSLRAGTISGMPVNARIATLGSGPSFTSATMSAPAIATLSGQQWNYVDDLQVQSAVIVAPNRIRLTLAAPPSTVSGIQVRYLIQAPVDGPNIANLNDLLYDNSGFSDTGGFPIYPTFTPQAVTTPDNAPMF